MLLPLHDKNPLKIIPFQLVTFLLICACVLVFLYQKLIAGNGNLVVSYGVIPAVLFDQRSLAVELVSLPAELTLLSSLFLHGGWMHLISNMLYLWIFGDNVEDSMGHLRFFAFYIICGLAAGLSHAVVNMDSISPLIGASGAIAGVLGAYLVLHPRVKVVVIVFTRIPLRLPAYLVIGVWIGLQIYSVISSSAGNTAWWAHIGGFVAGIVLIPLFKNASVPLFDRGIEH